MYAPHTVTVYNASPSAEGYGTDYNITLLEGVFLDISKGANILKSGLDSVDGATLFIPFSVKAVNAMTGAPQEYIDPKEYVELDDKTNYWTVRPGGSASSADCFFVKGETVESANYGTINDKYDYTYLVSSVDIRDFGSPEMQHFQVGGR